MALASEERNEEEKDLSPLCCFCCSMSRSQRRGILKTSLPHPSLSSSSLSQTTTTGEQVSFWQHQIRKPRRNRSKEREGTGNLCPNGRDSRRHSAMLLARPDGDFASLLHSSLDDSYRTEFSSQMASVSSTFIFALMAMLTAFLVVSVAVILLRADSLTNLLAPRLSDLKAAKAPFHFTLPLQTTEQLLRARTPLASETPSSAWELSDRTVHEVAPENVKKQASRRCPDVTYSYCSGVRSEFYFNKATNSCEATSADTTLVCNHSFNRFTSKRNCKTTCMDNKFSSERCYSPAVFAKCTSRDVRFHWWYFNGSECLPWHFPSGACPSKKKGGNVFGSLPQCATQCKVGEFLLSPCRPPIAVPCSPRKLRFPYFAVSSPDDLRVSCFKAKVSVLRSHLCLTGINRFNQDSDCRDACTVGGPRAKPTPIDDAQRGRQRVE